MKFKEFITQFDFFSFKDDFEDSPRYKLMIGLDWFFVEDRPSSLMTSKSAFEHHIYWRRFIFKLFFGNYILNWYVPIRKMPYTNIESYRSFKGLKPRVFKLNKENKV
jgi:hypothetical protein